METLMKIVSGMVGGLIFCAALSIFTGLLVWGTLAALPVWVTYLAIKKLWGVI